MKRPLPWTRAMLVGLVSLIVVLVWSNLSLRSRNAALLLAAQMKTEAVEGTSVSDQVVAPEHVAEATSPAVDVEGKDRTDSPTDDVQREGSRTETENQPAIVSLKRDGLERLKQESALIDQQVKVLEESLLTMATQLKITPEILAHPESAPEKYRTFFDAMQNWQAQCQKASTIRMRLKSEMVDLGVSADEPDTTVPPGAPQANRIKSLGLSEY